MDDFKKKLQELTGLTDDDAMIGRLAAWKDAHEKLPAAQSRVTELETADKSGREASAREAAITAGLTERKLTPDEAAKIRAKEGFLGTLSTEQLSAMIADRSPVAPTEPLRGARAPGGPSAAAEDDVKLTAEEERMARAMGNDPAEVLATKKARAAEARSAQR